MRLAFAVALALLVPGSAWSQEPEPNPPAPGAVEGVVRGGTDALPLEDAWVEVLAPDDRAVARTVTGEDGLFTVRLPAAGSWRLRVSRRDFVALVTPALQVGLGDTARVELTLEPRPGLLPEQRPTPGSPW